MARPGSQVAAVTGDPADVHGQVEVPPLKGAQPCQEEYLAISPDWREVVLQRRRIRDSMLVFAPNFSGTRRRILPRGDCKMPARVELRWPLAASGLGMHKSTTPGYVQYIAAGATTMQYTAGVGWAVASSRSAAQDSWAVHVCISRRMGCCGWRRRRMMGACDSAGAHDAR